MATTGLGTYATTLVTTGTSTPPEPALRKCDPNGLEPFENRDTALGTIKVVEDKLNGDFPERWTGKVYWQLEFKMEIPPPEKVNGQVVKKKAECFSCIIKDVKATFVVFNSNDNQDNLAKSLQKALNEELGVLFNGSKNQPYMGSPGLVHGVSATALMGPMNFPEIHTDNPAAAQSPANNRVRFRLEPSVTPETDNHSKFVSWECKVPGVDNLNAAQIGSLLNAAQAAVIEHNSQWQITPGGTFNLPIPAFPGVDHTRGQEGFAEMAVNPAPGAVCDIP